MISQRVAHYDDAIVQGASLLLLCNTSVPGYIQGGIPLGGRMR